MYDAQGALLQASSEPVTYLHGGYGGLLEALEAALEGKHPGESIKVQLEPEQTFGEYDAGLLRVEPAARYGAGLRIGMEVEDAFDGSRITDRQVRKRLNALALPPGWTDVWICPDPSGHIQATARDARGRKQYRYHPSYRDARDQSKFRRMLEFSEVLPTLRERLEHDLRAAPLSRRQLLATVVTLLDKTLIRVGNDEYVRSNRSYGLTTL